MRGSYKDEDERDPSFVRCLAVVVSGPVGLSGVVAGVSGGGWLITIAGTMLLCWSMYQWHKAIANYYSA